MTKPKQKSGIGVGSLRSLNIALLAKWWWQLKVDTNSLWSWCIKVIHNVSCIDGKPFAKCSISGTWLSIYQINQELDDWGISLDDLSFRKAGDGNNINFWKDIWCGDRTLKDSFPKLYMLEVDKNCMVCDRLNGNDVVGFSRVVGSKSAKRLGDGLNGLVRALDNIKLSPMILGCGNLTIMVFFFVRSL